MRRFGTQGRVYPDRHYVVSRTEEIADFIDRVKEGRYVVLFAPRQTGKTTFFRLALEALTTQDSTYFPIQLDFEGYEEYTSVDFYASLYREIRKEIEGVFQRREELLPDALVQFLANAEIIDHVSMIEFFEELAKHLATHYNIGLTQNELTYRLLLLTMVCEEVPKDDETHSCRLLSVFTQHTHQLHTDTFRGPFGDFQS